MSAASAFQGQDVPASLFSDFAPPEAYRPHLLGGTLWVVDVAGRPCAFLAALAHAIDHARARGFARLSLTTFRAIPWNAPFYASLGFIEWDPNDAPDSIRKALAKEAAFGLKDRCAMRLEL